MDRLPAIPSPDPCDYRTQSAPVVIQTVSGEWYTARWTVYQDADYTPVWELIGRDGLQLERDEVVSWFDCAAVGELIEAAKFARVTGNLGGYTSGADRRLASALARMRHDEE